MSPLERNSPQNRGRFLVLDGPDGGGKTTQAGVLADWLRGLGRSVMACRDPGGTTLGERLRDILLDRGTLNLAMRAEMLLYMGSRAQLVEEVVLPALDAGQDVVSDRFLLSNIIYQGYAGGLGVEEVGRVGLVATRGLLPDLTIVLDVTTRVAKLRVGRARDRLEDRSEGYHAKVREGFLKAVSDAAEGACPYYPARLCLVDTSADAQTVSARIRSEVERALALGPRS
jgi:dTMP kinase